MVKCQSVSVRQVYVRVYMTAWLSHQPHSITAAESRQLASHQVLFIVFVATEWDDLYRITGGDSALITSEPKKGD